MMGKSSIASNNTCRRSAMGGRADLAEVYYRAKDLIAEYNLLRLYNFEESGNVKRLTMCNIWRVELYPGHSIKTLEFTLAHKRRIWKNVTDLTSWPEIPFAPVFLTRAVNWSRDMAAMAIKKALIASGFNNLPETLTAAERWKKRPRNTQPLPQPDMTPSHMADILTRFFLGKKFEHDREGSLKWIGGRLKPESIAKAGRAIRANFYDHFVDKEILSALLVINWRWLTVTEYLKYARHRDGLLKVARERRNLLPLLPKIEPDQWGRDDLFSRKLWVPTINYDNMPKRQIVSCGGLDSVSAWRWLTNASPVVIRAWSNNGSDTNLISIIAQANINGRIPILAYCTVMEFCQFNLARVEPLPAQRFLRVFLGHCASMWKNLGFNAVRIFLRRFGATSLTGVLDYMLAVGFRDGWPLKNSTWESLARRSAEWHDRLYGAQAAAAANECPQQFLEWTSAVPELVIDGIIFRSLNNSDELAREGKEMHHCVGSYTNSCHDSSYRVYAVQEANGQRSTLGFMLNQNGLAFWNQHQGVCNGPVSAAALQAGRILVKAYNQALANNA